MAILPADAATFFAFPSDVAPFTNFLKSIVRLQQRIGTLADERTT